jgi:hypothetical protein
MIFMFIGIIGYLWLPCVKDLCVHCELSHKFRSYKVLVSVIEFKSLLDSRFI